MITLTSGKHGSVILMFFLLYKAGLQLFFLIFFQKQKSNKWLFYFLKDSEIDHGSQSIKIKQSNIYINEYIDIYICIRIHNVN